MKKLLLAIILFSIFLESSAQLTHIDTLYEWKEKWKAEYGEVFKYYRIYGETLIDGKTYKSVEISNDGKTFQPTKYYLWEDSSAKIYLKNVLINYEMLIYNFRLNKNDTFTTYPEPSKPDLGFPLKVIDVDSILIEGIKRKRILFEDHWASDSNEVWIEGIGSNIGFIYREWNFRASVPAWISLICVTKKDSLIYRNPLFADCSPPLSISQPAIKNAPVKVYPNPVLEEFNIEILNLSNFQFILFNNIGKEILIIPLNNRITTLHRGNLPPGIYYYRITGKNTEFKGKIMFN
jgi:hypothetical protein